MSLAFENFFRTSYNSGTGGVNQSTTGSQQISTSGADRMVFLAIISGTSSNVPSDFCEVTSINVSGLTFNEVYSRQFEYFNDGSTGGDNSFPYAAFTLQLFAAQADSVVTNLNWSVSMSRPSSNYVNNQVAWCFSLADLPNYPDFEMFTPMEFADLSGSSSTIGATGINTGGASALLYLGTTRNSGFTFTDTDGGQWTINQDTAGGNSTSNAKMCAEYGLFGALSGYDHTDASQSCWTVTLFGFGEPVVIPNSEYTQGIIIL